MRKHCKLGAGLIVLSLVALLLFWPAGEVYGHGHTIIYNRDDQMVTGFGGTEGIWSPTGDRVLTQTRIFGSAGIKQLQLPVGSSPVGWLDEGHILAERYLVFPHRYFT